MRKGVVHIALLISSFFASFSCYSQLSGKHLIIDNDGFCEQELDFQTDSTVLYYYGCETHQRMRMVHYNLDENGELHFRAFTKDEFLESIVLTRKTVPLGYSDSIYGRNPNLYIEGSNGKPTDEFQVKLYYDSLLIQSGIQPYKLNLINLNSDRVTFSIDFIDELLERVVQFSVKDFKGEGEDLVIQTTIEWWLLNTELLYVDSDNFPKLKYAENRFLVQKDGTWEAITE